MTSVSTPVLNFIVNALWQVTLVAAAAWLADRLLRSAPARYRHRIWVTALLIMLVLSLADLAPRLARNFSSPRPVKVATAMRASEHGRGFVVDSTIPQAAAAASAPMPHTGFAVPSRYAILLAGLYFGFVLFRLVALLHAWLATRNIVRQSSDVPMPEPVERVISRCLIATGLQRVRLLSSATASSPLTVGAWPATIVLPEALLSEVDEAVLTCALGHELVHVRRRDYLWNFVFRLLLIPFSFHPAAALIQRRIRQTRELCCDEQVTAMLLPPAAYARSLLELAGAARFGRPAATVAVGISDADILEERIMSMLHRPILSPAKRALLAVSAALVFAAPCIAAAPYVAHLNVAQDVPAEQQLPQPATVTTPTASPVVAPAPAAAPQAVRAATPRPAAAVGFAFAPAPRPAIAQEAQERKLSAEQLEADRVKAKVLLDQTKENLQERNKQLASLTRQAKITMQQAIDIATQEYPGAVAQTDLMGPEDFTVRGPDGRRYTVKSGTETPTYRIVIVSGDEETPVRTIVLVNAVDGTIVKTGVE